MKIYYITIMVLASMTIPSTAKTVPSTFDKNCLINWEGGGCGERIRETSDKSAKSLSARAKTSEPQEPPACDPKEKKDD